MLDQLAESIHIQLSLLHGGLGRGSLRTRDEEIGLCLLDLSHKNLGINSKEHITLFHTRTILVVLLLQKARDAWLNTRTIESAQIAEPLSKIRNFFLHHGEYSNSGSLLLLTLLGLLELLAGGGHES